MKTPGLISGISTPMPVLEEAAERVSGGNSAGGGGEEPRRAEQISQAHAEDVV